MVVPVTRTNTELQHDGTHCIGDTDSDCYVRHTNPDVVPDTTPRSQSNAPDTHRFCDTGSDHPCTHGHARTQYADANRKTAVTTAGS
ncbi:MAG: hypothetical protein PHG76_06195 [Eubacteriales bacterium]|nr:hypothetical protein [Eubacteriales bacterium]